MNAIGQISLEKFAEAAKKIADSVSGRLPIEVGVDVAWHPGGLVSVKYVARCGEVCGTGKDLYRLEIADSLENATDRLLNAITKDKINKSIREHYLRETAEELGFEVVKKGGGR